MPRTIFLSFTEMQRKYSLDICPLKYYGLLSTLKSLLNTLKNNYINNCYHESFAAKLAKCQSANKLVYTKLISTKCTHPTHNQQKWLKDCHKNDVDSINYTGVMPTSYPLNTLKVREFLNSSTKFCIDE